MNKFSVGKIILFSQLPIDAKHVCTCWLLDTSLKKRYLNPERIILDELDSDMAGNISLWLPVTPSILKGKKILDMCVLYNKKRCLRKLTFNYFWYKMLCSKYLLNE